MRSSRGRSRRRWTGARIARIAVAACFTLLLGWLSVRAAVVDALARPNPFLAAQFARSDPRVAIEMAMAELVVRNGKVASASRARALEALGRAGLADEPFLLAGVDAAAHGDAARSEKLLVEARRRNPRERLTALLLLDRYLRTGRSDEAGTELAVLSRLIPQAQAALVPQLLLLARDTKTRPGLTHVLRRNAGIRDLVLASLAQNPAEADVVMEIAAASGAVTKGPVSPRWQGVLLSGLVSHGEFGRAYDLWRGFLRQPPQAGGIYDADFRRAQGPPPFNWDLTSGSEGLAEGSHGTLVVQYYGRADVALASQLLLLSPGTYRLQFRAEGDAKGEGTVLRWTIACAGSKVSLLQLPLKGVASVPRTFAGVFKVPAGCPAQWLKLEGSAGDVAAEQDIALSALTLQATRAET